MDERILRMGLQYLNGQVCGEPSSVPILLMHDKSDVSVLTSLLSCPYVSGVLLRRGILNLGSVLEDESLAPTVLQRRTPS